MKQRVFDFVKPKILNKVGGGFHEKLARCYARIDLMFTSADIDFENNILQGTQLEPKGHKIAYELKTGDSGVNNPEVNFIYKHMPVGTELKEVHVKGGVVTITAKAKD